MPCNGRLNRTNLNGGRIRHQPRHRYRL